MVSQEDLDGAILRLNELFPFPATTDHMDHIPRFELSQAIDNEIWSLLDKWEIFRPRASEKRASIVIRRSQSVIDVISGVFRGAMFANKETRQLIVEKAAEENFNLYRTRATDTGLINDHEEWEIDKNNFSELATPKKWVKGRKSRAYLETFGFPLSFEPTSAIPAPEYYSRLNWSPYPPLEEYQREVSELIGQTLRRKMTSDKGTNRGLVTLPTGAGKTRVTVNALLRWFIQSENPPNILWLCHTKELAQQAEESIRRTWSSLCHDDSLFSNPQRDLRLYSFWSDTNWSKESGGIFENPMNKEGGIAICLVQTLHEIASSEDSDDSAHKLAFDSLKDPDAIIIDEVHRFETKSLRQTLDRLGVKVRLTVAEPSPIPIIGLTATPWKENIFNRYDRVLLPDLASQQNPEAGDVRHELYRIRRELIKEGVLSTAQYRPLRLDLEILLMESDLNKYQELDKKILNRLATDKKRGTMIIDDIQDILDSGKWKSMIVYAITVTQARALSTALSLRGIKSCVISGDTPRKDRAESISLFRKGEIQVICNHSVLTTGFDAPNTDVIYITRPVYSFTMLEQIVGRGLRGPKFNGTPDCLVITPQEKLVIERATGPENIVLAEDEIKRRIFTQNQ